MIFKRTFCDWNCVVESETTIINKLIGITLRKVSAPNALATHPNIHTRMDTQKKGFILRVCITLFWNEWLYYSIVALLFPLYVCTFYRVSQDTMPFWSRVVNFGHISSYSWVLAKKFATIVYQFQMKDFKSL